MKSKCVLFLGAMLSVSVAYAHSDEEHGHASHSNHSQDAHEMHGMMQHDNMFLVEKEVDDYKVSFHVMAAQEGMQHGGSHNVMIKIEQGEKTLDNVKINSKVVRPNGDAETKPLMKMGEWYMSGYDLSDSGKYQLMVLFKTADGSKHKAGVYYTVE